MKNYTSKTYDGIEIRFYEDGNTTIGKLYKDNKPVGIKYKHDKSGDIIHMETGSKTSIIKKIRNIISDLNSGKAVVVDADKIEGSKFTVGDVIIPVDTNVADITDILYVYNKPAFAFSKDYEVLTFDNNQDNLDIVLKTLDIKKTDKEYVCIGNDPSISRDYDDIEQHLLSISKIKEFMSEKIEVKLTMLNKTNDDFYNDLVNQIYQSDATGYEKEKYLEFLSAAYNNYKK